MKENSFSTSNEYMWFIYYNDEPTERGFNHLELPHHQLWCECIKILRNNDWKVERDKELIQQYRSKSYISFTHRHGVHKSRLEFNAEIYPVGARLLIFSLN